jgi:hypothetical protein
MIAVMVVTGAFTVMGGLGIVPYRRILARTKPRQGFHRLRQPRLVRDTPAEQHRGRGKGLERQRHDEQCSGESCELPFHMNRITQRL